MGRGPTELEKWFCETFRYDVFIPEREMLNPLDITLPTGQEITDWLTENGYTKSLLGNDINWADTPKEKFLEHDHVITLDHGGCTYSFKEDIAGRMDEHFNMKYRKKPMRKGMTDVQWEMFLRECENNGLAPKENEEFGSDVITAKYWFMLGWDARKETIED